MYTVTRYMAALSCLTKTLTSRYHKASQAMATSLKIAMIGQSVFAKDVYNLIKKNGHTVVGVFTIPDKNGREVRLLSKREEQMQTGLLVAITINT